MSMMLTSRCVKATLFIAGILAVGLGMYLGFHVDEVYGGGGWQHDTDDNI